MKKLQRCFQLFERLLLIRILGMFIETDVHCRKIKNDVD